MENGDKIVKLTSMVLFLAQGFVGLINGILTGSYASPIRFLFYSVLWLCLAILIGRIPMDCERHIRLYVFLNTFIVTGLSIHIAYASKTPILFMCFQIILWICNIFGLRKYVFLVLSIVDIVGALVLAFVLNLFSPIEFVAFALTIVISLWISFIFASRSSKVMGRIKEQNQSYDDMITLVESRFVEEKGANVAKSAFLASMSHEIRTPINAILGFNTMTMRESKDPQIIEYANEIESAGQTLLSLVNDILDISKVESGKMEIIPVEYNLKELINDVVTMISIKSRAKNLSLNVDASETLPSILYGDDVRIRQILINIMSNAVKYTEKGSVTLTVTGETTGNRIGLHFSVSDTGIGIKKEDMKKLFAKFERIDTVRNRNIEGTGLGMAITSMLLSLMNSSIEVQSEYGKGSTFSFYLMQEIVDKTPIGSISKNNENENHKKTEDEATFTIPKANILVVDDNKINRMVFSKLLKRLGPNVDEAAGGEEALKYSNEKKYDIIFLDHMMPGMDGIETLHKLREDKNNNNFSVPVIALTANAISGSREFYISEGFDDYLSKPIDTKLLEKIIIERIPEEKINR